MPFDGAFLHCVAAEINSARDAHIDKIYQPSREELVLVLRKKGFVKRLLISAKSGMARIHFTENIPENPETPPMFCMLARKHFSAARFSGVGMRGLERVAELCFVGSNELGDRTEVKIVCEFAGTANIVLVGNDGRVLDAVHRSDIEKDDRITAPGAVYEYPQSQGKSDVTVSDAVALVNAVKERGGRLSSALLGILEGVSPLVAREIAFRSFGDDPITAEIYDDAPLEKSISELKEGIKSGGTPYLYYGEDGSPKEFSFLKIGQYGGTLREEKCAGFSELLDKFYYERERISLQKRAGGDLEKLLKNLSSRAEKRMNTRIKELDATRDREKLRISGELLKANIHSVESGSTSVRVQNFYDPDMGYTDIPLDPALSAAANAAKYFKEYKKSYNAEQTLKELIEKDREEITYLDSVSESLSRAETLSDIAEIREELAKNGYVKRQQSKRKPSSKAPVYLSFESKEGYKIAVGKNNTQNDYLTTVLAGKNDMWFHTKNIHGSHVIVFCGGEELSEETVLFAAALAAKHSKAKDSSNVPVDYTPVKFVKKPSGAKPGMVIYTTNKTVFVTPGEIL